MSVGEITCGSLVLSGREEWLEVVELGSGIE